MCLTPSSRTTSTLAVKLLQVDLALAEVAVAATNNKTKEAEVKLMKSSNIVKNKLTGSAALFLAACALPGLMPTAHAETIPEFGTISAKLLAYHQSQPNADGANKASVTSPSVYISKPIAGQWLVEGSATYDNVSGASPRYHTTAASHMSDKRVAADVKVKKYFDHGTVSVGTAYSNENDYQSTAVSLSGTKSSDDNNTTFSGGVGYNQDKINPTNKVVANEKKRGLELQVGVTQVLTPLDIAQLNATYTEGVGYYSDPYKTFDKRPRNRVTNVLLAKWNHHFKDAGTTTRLQYRYYTDTFGIQAHTVGLEVVKTYPNGWTITPGVRYSTQSKADFYYDPPFPNGRTADGYYSSDQRLANMGSVTAGIKVSKQIDAESSIDFKLESYVQRTGLYLGSNKSTGLDPLKATMVQIGYSRKF
jgi:Protein of unknown function (DUF3570)